VEGPRIGSNSEQGHELANLSSRTSSPRGGDVGGGDGHSRRGDDVCDWN